MNLDPLPQQAFVFSQTQTAQFNISAKSGRFLRRRRRNVELWRLPFTGIHLRRAPPTVGRFDVGNNDNDDLDDVQQ